MFPKTLQGFGYDFDKDGKLRKIDKPTEGFEFNVSDDPEYNQNRYEALGEVINNYVYDLLEKSGLRRLPVPKEGPQEVKSFIFASDDISTNDKLVVLVHGSGVVRAGQWARRLIVNDKLSTGTQLPYIERARELGYAVIVLNTNDTERIVQGKSINIQGSVDSQQHFNSVWVDYIKPVDAKVVLIGHSFGGECIMKFATDNPQEFEKVGAVALTDSVHAMRKKNCPGIIKIARNWVCSDQPLDTPVPTSTGDVECVSAGKLKLAHKIPKYKIKYPAGHTVHEMSSSSSIDSVFKYILKLCTEKK